MSAEYAVTALPTFILFRNGVVVDKVKGGDPRKLQAVVEQLSTDIENAGQGSGSSSSGGAGGIAWRGAELPRGYTDLTDSINISMLDWSNVDESSFSKRTLYSKEKPSALGAQSSSDKDWIESDTDEQVMLYVPFNSTIKLHTLQVNITGILWTRSHVHRQLTRRKFRLPPCRPRMRMTRMRTTKHPCAQRQSRSS